MKTSFDAKKNIRSINSEAVGKGAAMSRLTSVVLDRPVRRQLSKRSKRKGQIFGHFKDV